MLRRVIAGAYAASLLGSSARFALAMRQPARVQERKLRTFLDRTEQSAYGREHGFSSITSVREFQKRVPIVDYDALSPYIDRIAGGEREVLSLEPTEILEESSGSTAKRKLIPYNKALREEFGAATGPWMAGQFSRFPGLLGTTSYWSVSPAGRKRERTAGGVRIGFESDTEYFDPVSRWAIERLLSVPSSLARLADVDEWRLQTARTLVNDADLGFISVWNPSFLTLLMRFIESEPQALMASLSSRRRAALRAALVGGRLRGELLWPRLALISCWADANAEAFVAPMRNYFGDVPVEAKGLLATEGVVSFPVGDPRGAAVAVTSHFLEFVDLQARAAVPSLAHELRLGAQYSPLLTTASGFARYHLQDVLECVGFVGKVPLVKFIGKLDRTSDICGEKLDATRVDAAVTLACHESGVRPQFVMLAPSIAARPRYMAYVESASSEAELQCCAASLEARLRESYHYAYARDLGQLDAVGVKRVRRGYERYQEKLVSMGVKLGNIKPTQLDSRTIWDDVYSESPE